ncbi:hypothetical protein PO124_28755 [Bacillus licheniformis]|nr:hypothetical protein [Bacillus licheniformis]
MKRKLADLFGNDSVCFRFLMGCSGNESGKNDGGTNGGKIR